MSSLGKKYAGWQALADRLKTTATTLNWQIHCKPKNGYLAANCDAGAPRELIELCDEIEVESDQICQLCGGKPAYEVVGDGWIWKLCPVCSPLPLKRQ